MRIVCDNGTESAGKAMFFQGERQAVNMGIIRPGKPALQYLRGDSGRQVPQ